MKPFSAQEARSMSESNPEMLRLFDRIADDAKTSRSTHFFPEKCFSDTELLEIRSLGYTITWDRACCWYEVSW